MVLQNAFFTVFWPNFIELTQPIECFRDASAESWNQLNIQTSFSRRLVYLLPLISELAFLVNIFAFSLLAVVLCASHLTTATFKDHVIM